MTMAHDGPPLPPPPKRKNTDEPEPTNKGMYMLAFGLAGVALMRTLGVPDGVDIDRLALVCIIWFLVSLLAMICKI